MNLSKAGEPKIKARVRLIIIKNEKLLVSYTSKENFYFYIGGKIEFGETIEEACEREIIEECGKDVVFSFNKVLYIRDYIKEDEHSIEFYILGDINKYLEVEGKVDPEYPESHTQTWVDMGNLPENLLPKSLTKILLEDYKKDFPRQGIYLGKIN